MRMHRAQLVASAALVLALVAGACGSSKKSTTTATTQKKGSITMAAFNFSESDTLAAIYGKALQAKGYTVTFRPNLGSREVVEPALLKGDVDAYVTYAATELTFLKVPGPNGQASSDTQQTVSHLRDAYTPKSISVLDASSTIDSNAFAVTKATADKYHLAKMSDLTALTNQLTLGGPPECPTRPFCQPGLEKTYGLKFKPASGANWSFRPLDSGGPLSKNALSNGDVQMALIFSSDGAVQARNFVVLDDDKHLQDADNVVPVIRTSKVNSEITDLWNRISTKLTTADLVAMNKKTDVDKEDSDAVADQWLRDHGFKS
jgi:osmoprotectant transport system substrate-binding protein